MQDKMDDMGNVSVDFESMVGEIAEIDGTDGQVVNEAPKETKQDSKAEEPEVVEVGDEFDSIIDDLTDEDDDDAGDEPSEDSKESDEESKEEEVVDEEKHTVKIDGEEIEVSTSELIKGYGLQQSLTRKGQEIAESKKALEKEAQAVAWAKEAPERRELAEQITEANEAIQRGFTFGPDGEQIRLTQGQIDATKVNVQEAMGKLQELATPPRLNELQEAVPGMFSQDQQVVRETLEPFGNTLREVGYSEAEIQSQNDPRIFFLLKELHEARDVVSRVEKAKARRKEKAPAIASKPTKAAKSARPSSSKSSEAPKSSTKEIYDKIAAGDASPADLFMD